ncbi:LuxR family transcriptional regulator [Trinickia sp. LjRoot230]|uniref:helix-turn-helix transcriptional regulator n=1 Tax=Trinickia sp. LjRoot230 TaxID=3342288 RepID=UPI003ECE43B8
MTTIDCQTSFARELSALRTGRQRARALSMALSLLGFDSLAHLTLLRSGKRTIAAYMPMHYMQTAYWNRYFGEGHYEIDPCAIAAHQNAKPLVWSLAGLHAFVSPAGENPRKQDLLKSMARHAMKSGITFRISSRLHDIDSILHFTSSNSSQNWITPSLISITMALGFGIHEILSTFITHDIKVKLIGDLSDMQYAILASLATGMSDKEIAMKLHTTHHNIDYHLRELRKHYGVSNRTQLAFVGGQLGIV